MFGLGRRMTKVLSDNDSVEVAELDGVRSLYIGSNTIQSSMRLSDPDALELAYARGMMLFLLFSNQLRNVLILGLGGGSIAKYIYRFLPQAHTTVLEINAKVIQLARQLFFLPEDDARLQVIQGDGLAFLSQCDPASKRYDVLMLDAYDSHGVLPDMVSQDFFDRCASLLSEQGFLMVNLWGSDRNFEIYFARIQVSFAHRVIKLRTSRPGNIVVMGFAQMPADVRWASLRQRAKQLEQQYGIEFLKFVEQIKDDNPASEHRLLLGEA
jgi:spermidine synthase